MPPDIRNEVCACKRRTERKCDQAKTTRCARARVVCVLSYDSEFVQLYGAAFTSYHSRIYALARSFVLRPSRSGSDHRELGGCAPCKSLPWCGIASIKGVEVSQNTQDVACHGPGLVDSPASTALSLHQEDKTCAVHFAKITVHDCECVGSGPEPLRATATPLFSPPN